MSNEIDINTYIQVAEGALAVAARRAQTLEECVSVWRANLLLPEDEWHELHLRIEDAIHSKATSDSSWREKFELVYTADELGFDVAAEVVMKILCDNAADDPFGFFTALSVEASKETHLKDIAYEIMQTMPINEEPEEY